MYSLDSYQRSSVVTSHQKNVCAHTCNAYKYVVSFGFHFQKQNVLFAAPNFLFCSHFKIISEGSLPLVFCLHYKADL